MQAIETVYKGYRFRSRLEARWAVFFDALGIEWEYEPEGFDLGGTGYYLPDFKLHNVIHWNKDGQAYTLYVEVKGLHQDTANEREQILVFAYELWEINGGKAILVSGCPSNKMHIYNPGVTDSGCNPGSEYNATVHDFFSRYPRLTEAVLAAGQARFEHGQSGALSVWRPR